MTTINFGGEDLVIVYQPLEVVRDMVQKALSARALLELTAADGEKLVINPLQVKLIQPSVSLPPPR